MSESQKNPVARYLSAFRARAPQTAAIIAALTVLHGSPARASESLDPLRLLAQRAPAVRLLPPGSFAHVFQQPGGSQMCFGPVRSSGDRAEALMFDRRLGILTWLDRRGLPTDAPRSFKDDATLILVGEVAGGAELATGRVTYLFAEKQRSDGVARTMAFVQERLARMDLATAPSTRVSPFAGCSRGDVLAYGGTGAEPSRVRAVGGEIGRAIGDEALYRVKAAGRDAVNAGAQSVLRTILPE